MQRLLIANRGEIAVRIARTAAELGIPTLGVHCREDAALARRYRTDALAPLQGRGAEAYLDAQQIATLAEREGCDAVHPGYGFLSESPEFARAVEAVGSCFVGPSPEALELFGDKAAARALAQELRVPVLRGTGAKTSQAEVLGLLESLGPGASVMLKACAGGGGRGLRVVRNAKELEEAYPRCQSEALRSFGSDALLAERLVERARHLEVQIVADAAGSVSHLWERECTLQRQHQKLIEIAPSPWLDADLRSRLIRAALAMAAAGRYRNLGTFEFLVEESGEYHFIEANPRLQVEHTVTEQVAGVDLVELQLRIAEGAGLGDLGLLDPPPVRGHAIQARIYSETIDRDGGARPGSGLITAFEVPNGPGIRVDTAVGPGITPDPAFDALLAKLVVSSDSGDFARALERARRAIGEFRIAGPPTNLPFLAALLAREELATGELWTTFIAEHASALLAHAETLQSASESPASRLAVAAPQELSAPDVPPGCEALTSPLIGTVIELKVAVGDSLRSGQPVCILESMKMEHVVVAPASGSVQELLVCEGDVLDEGAAIAFITRQGDSQEHEVEAHSIDLERIRPELEESRTRHALLLDESRPEAVARRRSRGQRTARENLDDLCDPESFIEYGALAVAAQRKLRPIEELQRRTPADAIITGFGTVNADRFGAERARCAVLVVDATVLAGTQGYFHHKKIDRILELAERYEAPVVFFPEGGGGRPNDTDLGDISVAGLNITSFHVFARLSGKVPRVSVVSGFCFAGSAAFAGCADVIIATRNTSIGMGGPAMIEGGGLGSFPPEAVGPVSVQGPNGVLDLVVEDEAAAVAAAKQYLSYFQGSLESWSCSDQRQLRHLIPENRRRVYDIRALIDTLCDQSSVLELRRAYGVGMVTALVRIEGRPFGLLANDSMHLGGAIDDSASQKAARFLQLCDGFGLPVISLCDTPGFMVGPEVEQKAQVRKVSRLFVAGASLSVPLFTIILRKGYGLGAQAMAGGSFVAPLFTAAWPTAEIGGMGLEGAVRLGFRQQLADTLDEHERDQLFQKLVGLMYAKGRALNAASALEFDAVIDPEQTRTWLMRGLNAAGPISRGTRGFIDTW